MFVLCNKHRVTLRSREPKGQYAGEERTKSSRGDGYCSFLLDCLCLALGFSRFAPPGLTAEGGRGGRVAAGMKYNYHVPVSTYTRSSQYTPTYHTPTYYTASHYTPTTALYAAAYTSPTKYTSTQYSAPSQYTSTYRPASTYTPSYSKGSRYSSTRRTAAQESPAPVIPVAPAKRTVHFPNDIIFQDIVRRGDLEQIGRFMRARKVRVDALFHSGTSAQPFPFALHCRAISLGRV